MNFNTKKNKLVRTRDANLDKNFIALGMTVGSIDGVQQGGHSVLFICLKGELWVFHFDNGRIILELASDDPRLQIYYHRKLDFFSYDDSEMDAYMTYFKQVQLQSGLKYGFIFDGSFYDPATGKHFSKSGLPELSTCVGFCINVLTGLIIEADRYVEFEDWTNEFYHPDFDVFYQHAKKHFPEITEEDYKNHHRRISPNECTLTAYFSGSDLPIRKALLDGVIADFLTMVATLDVA